MNTETLTIGQKLTLGIGREMPFLTPPGCSLLPGKTSVNKYTVPVVRILPFDSIRFANMIRLSIIASVMVSKVASLIVEFRISMHTLVAFSGTISTHSQVRFSSILRCKCQTFSGTDTFSSIDSFSGTFSGTNSLKTVASPGTKTSDLRHIKPQKQIVELPQLHGVETCRLLPDGALEVVDDVVGLLHLLGVGQNLAQGPRPRAAVLATFYLQQLNFKMLFSSVCLSAILPGKSNRETGFCKILRVTCFNQAKLRFQTAVSRNNFLGRFWTKLSKIAKYSFDIYFRYLGAVKRHLSGVYKML